MAIAAMILLMEMMTKIKMIMKSTMIVNSVTILIMTIKKRFSTIIVEMRMTIMI